MEELYIVTGAAGFLGSTIVRQLVEKNKRVRAFVLPNDKSVEYLPSNIEIVKGDLLDIDSLENLFKDSNKYITYVMHIASIVTVDPEYSQLVMDVNVKGTKNIIDMSIKYNIKRLLYCSSTGAIPELKKGKISETESFDENKVLGCYSKSKALATKLVLSYKDKLDVVVVHPSGILGPNDYAKGETTRVLIDIINGKMKAGINGSFNLCDVRDLANGAISALKNGKRGECYILANDEVSFKKFAKMISKEAKNNKKVKLFLPIWLSNIIAKKMEKRAKKKGTKPLMTTFSVYNLARNNDFSSEKAKKELGYETRSYEITIKDEVKWLKERGLIHAAGLKYDVDCNVPCHVKTDSSGMFVSVDGEYRVKNLMVYNKNTKEYEPLDDNKEYLLGGINYLLRNQGNGLTMFNDSELVLDYIDEDYTVFAKYFLAFGNTKINNQNSPLKGYINYLYDYENPYGSNRINILNLKHSLS